MFNEATVVEAFILERMTNAGWTYIFGPSLARQTTDVIVEAELIAALIRLNPEIATDPSRADEVIYKLRCIFVFTILHNNRRGIFTTPSDALS